MYYFMKYLLGVLGTIAAYLSPIKGMVICALIFIGIDFVTGIVASHKRAQKNGKKWAFESEKAWRTGSKLVFVMGGICMAWMIDKEILNHLNLNLAKLFTGFICGVEFWSYLENAAEISDHPVFRWLQKFMKKQFKDKADIDFDDCDKTVEK